MAKEAKEFWNILALYLLVQASREGHNRVTLSNECLKKCMKKERIHGLPLFAFSRHLQPIWQRPSQGADRYGMKTNLTLCSSTKPEHNSPSSLTVRTIPPIGKMCKEIGLDPIG